MVTSDAAVMATAGSIIVQTIAVVPVNRTSEMSVRSTIYFKRIIVATDALQHRLLDSNSNCDKEKWHGARQKGNVQYSQTQDKYDGNLLLECHLHIPDHWDWQQREEPVRDDGHDRNRICCLCKRVSRHAFGVLNSQVPLSCNRFAL